MKKISIILMGLGMQSLPLFGGGLFFELRTGPCMPAESSGFKFRTTVNTTLELGYSIESWRFGLQLGYTQFDVKSYNKNAYEHHFFKDELKARSYMLTYMCNAYHDFSINDHWAFYVGIGFGYVRYRVYTKPKVARSAPELITSDVKYLFAGQIMTGISYEITESWRLIVGYRCMKTSNTHMINNSQILVMYRGKPNKIKTPLLHSFEVGLRYNF